MATTIISGLETTTAALNSFDNYFLTQTGEHYVTAGGSVIDATFTNNVTIDVHGTIYSNGGFAADLGGADDISFNIGVTGSLITARGTLGIVSTGDNIAMTNLGQISTTGLVFNGVGAEVFNGGEITSNANNDFPNDPLIVMGNTAGSFLNTGTITSLSSLIMTVGGSAVLVNNGIMSGTQGGLLFLGGQFDAVLFANTGVLQSSEISILGGESEEFIRNSGSIIGAVVTNDGDDDIVNTGIMIGGIGTFGDNDRVVNLGSIDGEVILGEGNDIYRAVGDGVTLGTIYGGGGSDTLTGANAQDIMEGGEDVDTLRGNGNDDELYGGGGDDRMFGGADNDVLYGEDGDDVVSGDNGDDVLFGEGDDDRIFGGNGDDSLFGGAGDDRLFGGDGDDFLYGGGNRDQFYGGEGRDTFVFADVTESPNSGLRDVIFEFEQGEDLINITQLNGPLFDFLGTGAFTGTGAEVRALATATGTNVFIDVDGDGTADMRIFVDGIAALTAGDFVL